MLENNLRGTVGDRRNLFLRNLGEVRLFICKCLNIMYFLSFVGCFHIERFLFSYSVTPFLSLFSIDGLLLFNNETPEFQIYTVSNFPVICF